MKEKELDFHTAAEFVFWLSLLYLYRKGTQVSMFLTKYFPFSLLGDWLFYHHRNRKIVYLRNYLFDTTREVNLSPQLYLYEEDQYFVHFWAKLDGRASQKKIQALRETFLGHFGASSAYMDKERNNTYHFKVAVEKVCE